MITISDVKKQYYKQGLGKTLYTYLRFWEYPRLVRIEELLPKTGTIIDLGSGHGIFSNYAAATSPKRYVLACEFDKKKTEVAKKAANTGRINNITFDNKDITKINIKKADAIVVMHVLHHLKSYEEQKELIGECVNKLDKGGILLIDEVDKKYTLQYFLALLTDNLLYPGDRFYYRSRKDMISFLSKFPLIVDVRNVSSFLMPYPELVYICKKK